MTMPFLIEWRTALRSSDLSWKAKLVGFVLSTHMDAQGGSCFPAIPTIAREASISERSVQTGLRELERAGVVVTERRGGRRLGGGYASNTYRARLPEVNALRRYDASGAGDDGSGARDEPAAAQEMHPRTSLEVVHEDVHEGANTTKGAHRSSLPCSEPGCDQLGDFIDRKGAWCDEHIPF